MDNPVFELGTWVGRRQAFALIANKCSAADAECLKEFRASKRYKPVASSWEEFCPRYLGLSRTHADRIIQQLEEFGSTYFSPSEIVRIPGQATGPSGAISECSIGAERIAEVVALLRREVEQARSENLSCGIRRRHDSCLAEIAAMEYTLERVGRLARARRE